ncbi:L-cystine import ATP-binding protein TcyC [Acholeplasma oculi]|uniref:Histidine/Arginine/Glutamine/Glutamate ABC transporter, ATP-binding protein n=1 Tax=Acholeplasma oculi TaxID=35623 RepID=A0A061A9S7_9MOLU|nr:ATP-binding cassette domain-containing protein [Acholeplasma oculi]CDR30149.1 Histidine/Arginine/Glutamine/Glutamate ABC transporter, ATP-binding protein [Acholeplasma oculi]SKC44502.1 polar amino acid transport system ATP-binding protein [Acholeplasma oculi]SUT88459.1 L-cystine import ATP-binding protein TcyC [Acholeplasma oculi]
MLLKTKGLTKSFLNNLAVNDVSIELSQGEVLSIIGPSGSGKSTLLKLINQLETPDKGEVFIDGVSLQKSSKQIRNQYFQSIGFIFQDFALFEHLTVKENLELSPRIVHKKDRNELKIQTQSLLELVGLPDKLDSYPITLSGGQKQRIAIARALATKPKILLFDEPTSALDVKSIDDLVSIIKKLKAEGIGILIVTHDLRFAKLVSDRLLFMKNSSIILNKDINDIIDIDLIFDTL